MNTIETGLGNISYNTDNLDLKILMETFAEKIKQYGPKNVLNLLEAGLKTSK